MNFSDTKPVGSSKRDRPLDPNPVDQEDSRKAAKAGVIRHAVVQKVFSFNEYKSDTPPGSKRGRKDAGDVPDEIASRKELKLRVKVPSRRDLFKETAARIVKAKFDKLFTILGEFGAIESAFLDSPGNKKDIRGLNRSLQAFNKKIQKIDQQFPDGALPFDDRLPEENRFALICQSKRGKTLYSERGPNCDLIMNVRDSNNDLIASEFVHKKQIESFSNEFDFQVNPGKQEQFVLNVTFEGTAKDFEELLKFIDTGELQAAGFSQAVLQFARKYDIKKILDFDQEGLEKGTLLDRLLELGRIETIDEMASAIQTLLELGFCENELTRKTLQDQFKGLCQTKFRSVSKGTKSKIVKDINKKFREIQEDYDFFDVKEDDDPLKKNNLLFDFSKHSKYVSPSLQCALMEAADQSEDSDIRILGKEESSNYCIEPPSAAILLQGKLCAVTVGIVSNEQNMSVCFYMQADPSNPVSLNVILRPQGLRALKCASLMPGQIIFFPCKDKNIQNIMKAARLTISHANPEAGEQAFAVPKDRQGVVFHTWNKRRAEWIIERNRLLFAAKAEQAVLAALQELASAAAKIKNANGLREIRGVAFSIIELLQADLPFMPCTLGRMNRFLCAHNTPFQKLRQVNSSTQCQPSSSICLQEAFPRNALSAHPIPSEPSCRFVFQGDGTERSFPLQDIKGRMVFANAGLPSQKRDLVLEIPLEGNSSDLNNQFLIEYVQTNCVPIRPLSVNELGAIILFGERYAMTDFVEKVKLHYLSRPKLVGKGEMLALPLFRHFRYNQSYELLIQLVQREECTTSQGFVERVQLLHQDSDADFNLEDDKKLLKDCVKALCREKNLDMIIEAIAWAKSEGHASMHLQICRAVAAHKIIITTKDYLRFVLEAGFDYKLSYPLTYSTDINEFFQEFNGLYRAFLASSGGIRKALNRTVENCLDIYCDRLIVSSVRNEEELVSASSEDEDDVDHFLEMLLPTHAVHCVQYKLNRTEELTIEESGRINDFLNEWSEYQEDQQKDQLKVCLSTLPYTNITTLHNFITFAEKAYDRDSNSPLISHLKFRKIVIQFNRMTR